MWKFLAALINHHTKLLIIRSYVSELFSMLFDTKHLRQKLEVNSDKSMKQNTERESYSKTLNQGSSYYYKHKSATSNNDTE